MLAGSVDAIKWLFIEQACKSMLLCSFAENVHGELVVINSGVCFGEYRGKFELGRGDFIMFGLGIDAELPEFLVDILHEFRNTGRDGSEVMIAEFLALAGAPNTVLPVRRRSGRSSKYLRSIRKYSCSSPT